MWKKSYSIVTNDVTKEQMWKLFSDVNNWNMWDKNIEYAKMNGNFEKGQSHTLKPKGWPELKIEILEAIENQLFIDLTRFPLAKMYFSHMFEDTKDGLKITYEIKVTWIFSFIWRKIVAENIFNNLPLEINEQIKYASKL